MQQPNKPACDIWSLGCTIIELVTGFPPYFDSPAMTAVFKMVSEPHPPLPDDVSPVPSQQHPMCAPRTLCDLLQELEDFLMQCFQRDPGPSPNTSIIAPYLLLV